MPGYILAAFEVTADYYTRHCLEAARRRLEVDSQARCSYYRAEPDYDCDGRDLKALTLRSSDHSRRREGRAERIYTRLGLKFKCNTDKNDIRRCHGETLKTLLSQSNGYARVTTAKQIEITTKIQN